MNRFVIDRFWSNTEVPKDQKYLDRWANEHWPDIMNWLAENVKAWDWEYDLVVNYYDYDFDQCNYAVFITFQNENDALLYKLRWG